MVQKIPRSFGTHDGTFHADEVTACALLLIFNCIDADKITRSREMELLQKCEYVCDVGGVYDIQQKIFDHHQIEYIGGLSSAGMILLYLLSTEIISQKEYDFLNDTLVKGVDAHDNGKEIDVPGLCSYSHIISSYNPVFNEEDSNDAFYQALDFAKGFLSRTLEKFHYMQSCRESVAETMKKYTDCLIFDENIPWLELFFELGGINHPAQYVIMPSPPHWKLRGIPPNLEHRMQVRTPLPQEWAGLLDEEFKKVSGLSGAVFCHKGRFISVWETKQDALQALEKILGRKSK